MPLPDVLRSPYTIGAAGSLVLLGLAAHPAGPVPLSLLEAVAVVSYAWSVWLLAQNKPLGWWIGLVGVVLYMVVFYEARLFAEIGIQAFYLVTSLQAIYIWLRGGADKTEKPVGRVPKPWLAAAALVAVVGTLALREGLIALRGAAPFWDALTTVVSLIAQVFLMMRYVESWYLWLFVDTIYVPLYASRGLYATSVLYGVFLVLAVKGLRTFRRLYRERHGPPDAGPPSRP